MNLTIIPHDSLSRTESGTLVTEASDIGLRPGTWPMRLQVEGGEIYDRWRAIDHNGEFSGYEYRTAIGYVLRIYND